MNKILSALLIVVCCSTLFSQRSLNVQKMDEFIRQGMAEWEIPGLSALVVSDGQLVFKKAYGIRNIETAEKVNTQTLFNMGSTTKAIICIAMGMLVDEGKLNWDDPVVKHYPEFRLSDPYITADARIRDLLIHNLGMGNADLLWTMDSTSTEAIVKKFQIPDPVYPLRGGYTYQNIMYVIAGQVIEEVSGMHWSEFVTERIFNPLGMDRSLAGSPDIYKPGNFVHPHYDDWEDGLVRIPHPIFDHIGAAGIIWSCIDDMEKYVSFILNDGIVEGDTLLNPETFAYIFKPHTILPDPSFYPTQQLTQPNWRTYGLGWFQHDYRGEKLNFHTGSISGLVAIAAVIPEKDFGMYFFANLDHAELRHAIMYKALDLFVFDDDSRDWHQEIFDLYSGFIEQGKEAQKNFEEKRVTGTQPTLPTDSLSGEYVHEMYGTITVSSDDQKLNVNVNDYLFYEADHWHYNTFRTNKDPQWRSRNLVNFVQNSSGKVEYLEFGGAGKFFRKD